MKNYQITNWVHHFIKDHVQLGDICIDATMGNGNDTALLSKLVGKNGKVIAFDIQQLALDNTKEKLIHENCPQNYELILSSHEEMLHYAKKETVSCITFNLGYLPGGDHAKSTKGESSILAIQSGLELLKKKGMMTICIYSGGDSGFEEKNVVLPYIKGLNPKEYLVIVSEYANRPNNPPIPVLIIKL